MRAVAEFLESPNGRPAVKFLQSILIYFEGERTVVFLDLRLAGLRQLARRLARRLANRICGANSTAR